MLRKYGLFTELQVKVLIGRHKGLTLRELSKILGTSHQNISVAEKRAHYNLEIARRTITIYNLIASPIKIVIDRNTHLMDIPKIVVSKCDRRGIRLRADFTLIYKLIRFNVAECVSGTRVIEPILITIDEFGNPYVYRYNNVKELHRQLQEIGQKMFR